MEWFPCPLGFYSHFLLECLYAHFPLVCFYSHYLLVCFYSHNLFKKSFYNNIFIHTSCCVLFTLPFFFFLIMMIYLFTLPAGMCAFSHTLCWYVCVFIYSSDCTLHIAVCCALQCVIHGVISVCHHYFLRVLHQSHADTVAVVNEYFWNFIKTTTNYFLV